MAADLDGSVVDGGEESVEGEGGGQGEQGVDGKEEALLLDI